MKVASKIRHTAVTQIALLMVFAALLLSFGIQAAGHIEKKALAVLVQDGLSPHGDGGSFQAPAGSFVTQPAPALGLTMADFTGDTHPDLATVELDRVDVSNAHYSIQIRLTEGRSQTIDLTAPFGGLVVVPKDVTGDGNLDLVVHTAKTHALIAVFLNDGNGHFDPVNNKSLKVLSGDDSYPSVFTRLAICQSITAGFPESHGLACPHRALKPLLRTDDFLLRPSAKRPVRQFPYSSPDRAPPSFV